MSQLREQWMQGQGLPGTLVIDGHIHINGWPQSATFNSVEEAVEQSLMYLDAHGIDAFCSLGGGHLHGGDYRHGNDFLLAVWQRLPQRMIPFMNVNPNDTQANILAELERMTAAGVRGIKLVNSYQLGYPGDGPNLMALYEFAAAHGMIILNHAWPTPVILNISAMYPDMTFILGHYDSAQNVVLQTRPNVYASTWCYGATRFIETACQTIGAAKLLLGSDGFMNPLSVGIGSVVFADISDNEKRLILGQTMKGLLEKAGATGIWDL